MLDLSTLEQQLINCPVIAYHHFVEEMEPWMQATNSIAKFEKDLVTLLDDGYMPISIAQRHACIAGEMEWPSKPFVLTMDDGYESNYTLAYPIFKRLGVHTDILIVTDTVGARVEDGVVGTPHFTWEQAREMENSGYATMQPHGRKHENNSLMSREELHDNVFGCIDAIEQNLGKRDTIVYSIAGGFGVEYTYENYEYLHANGLDYQCMNYWGVEQRFLKFNIVARLACPENESILEHIERYKQGLRERILNPTNIEKAGS